MEDFSKIHIESSLPKPWEQEQSFNDVLYDWMSRAPWLALSLAAHLLIFFILMAVPWELLGKDDEAEIQARIEAPPEELFEEEEEEPEEIEEEEIIEEPVLQDAEVEEVTEVQEFVESTEDVSPNPFDSDAFNDVIGIGGGAGGGKFGQRAVKGGRPRGGRGTAEALRNALEWLKAHQNPGGSWDPDDFMANCGQIGSSTCEGPGNGNFEVGLTGLATLAFLGDGHSTESGEYQDVVRRAIQWLMNQRDPDTGLIGERNSLDFIYNHALATLALTESYYFVKSPPVRRVAQDAIHYIQRARNPYGAWRYDVPPIGDNDTSVTGWMVFALASAKDVGLEIDEAAFDGALDFINEVTDPATGRVGYDSLGSLSSRTVANEHFPREKGEAMTAVGMLCRIFIAASRGEDISDDPILRKHAELMEQKLPVWDPEGFGCDMYYWYYGSYAMFQMGKPYWPKWQEAMEEAVVKSQRRDGDEKGSWDPVGPWGHAGGRVYSTATMALCLEVYYRYAPILGAR